MESTIWFQDPEQLIDPTKLTSFVPSRDDTLSGQLNACVRFSVYLAVTLFFLYFAQGKVRLIVFYIPVFMMIFTYFLYRFHPNVEKFHVPLENQPLRVIEKKHIVPKPDNPFMNPLPTDFGRQGRKPVAPPNITPVKKEIEKQFNHNLYHDIEDVFSRNHSQRQFYTTPSTSVPNDQENFAKWLYGQDSTCKESKSSCNEKW